MMSPLKCLAEWTPSHRPYHLAVSPGHEVIVACSQEGSVTVLSSELRSLGSLDLRSQVDGIAVGPSGKYLGFSLRDRTCVMNAGGEVVHEARHDPWPDCAGGGCAFSPTGRFFWEVRPGDDEREITVQVTASDEWRAVAMGEFEAEEAGFWTLVPHPEGGVVGLWIGAGQDGQWLYWCAIDDGRLYVEEEPALAWTGPPVFHPAGGEFLTDSLEDGLLRRHRFPDGRVIGQRSDAEIFSIEDPDGEELERFGGDPRYLSDRRALVPSSNDRIRLLDLGTMKSEGELLLEGCAPRPHHFGWNKREHRYGDVEQFLVLPGGRLLTVHRDWIERPANPDYKLRIWDTSSLYEEMRGPQDRQPFTEAFFAHFLR